MPSRTIRYVPPAPLRDDDFISKLNAEGRLSEVSTDNRNASNNNYNNTNMRSNPPAQRPRPEQDGDEEEDEDTFESLDRVAPLPIPRGLSETFTARNFKYADLTVNHDEDDDDRSEGSDGSSSSEDAFIEVNHDDASVVSTLTLETVLLSSSKPPRKKKKKKKEGSKKKNNSKKKATLGMMIVEEEDDGSRSEASEQTDKTGKTQNTARSSLSKKPTALKDAGDVDKSAEKNASADEIIEVSTRSKRLPALSNLDTISTQPTSAKTTDAVMSGFGGGRESQRAPEADTASEVAPPIPKKSDHSVELFSPDEIGTVASSSQVEAQTPIPTKERHTPDAAEISLEKKPADEASVKSTGTKGTVAKKTKGSPKGSKRHTASANRLDSATTKSSPPASQSTASQSASTKPKSSPPAKPASTSSLKMTPLSPKPVKSSVTKESPPVSQKPASTSSLKPAPEKPASMPILDPHTDRPAKPASTNRLQAPSSPASTRRKSKKVDNMIPSSPVKQAQNQESAPPKKPPSAAPVKQNTVPTSASGSLPKKPPTSGSQPVKNPTVARMPVTSTHSEGIIPSGSGGPQGLSSVDTTPGAYHVKGSKMMLASAHDVRDDFSITDTSTASRRRKSKQAHPQVPQSPASSKNLVVAAELSDDVEAKIEEEVRRRIMASAVQADLVSVTSDPSTTPPTTVSIQKMPATDLDLKEQYKPKGVKERLFGDSRQVGDIAASPESICRRDYLQWVVKRNPATNQWIASVTTNQQAMEEGDNIEMEMSKVSYAAQTQQEAFETGLSNATPLMQRFNDNPICHCCKSKFAMFRRPVNCRNCGVCICSSCTATWPSKMLPETYLKKNEKSTVTVCLACDWLAHSFQNALLSGNYSLAVDLYSTGNVNLRSPYWLDKKEEAMFPIHLATVGGNLRLVRWLISDRFCPLEMIDPKKKVKNQVVYSPVLTSKGMSALEIALLHQRLDIVHYFVAEQGMSMFYQKNISADVALANLTSLLNMLPPNFFEGMQMQISTMPSPVTHLSSASGPSNIRRNPSL